MSEILKNVPTDEVVAALYNDLRSRVEAVEPNDAIVAPDYADLTLPILVGTRCTHNRGLYKCNTQINSSEAWTAAHWDEITVGSELDTVNSQVIVSASQPQESNNKLWIKNGSGDEYTVPTYAEHQELLTAIHGITPDAQQSDIGKALILKTIDQTGKPTAFEYGEAGGGSVDPSVVEQKVDEWLEKNITNPNSPPLDRSLSSGSAAAPADIMGEFMGHESSSVDGGGVLKTEYLPIEPVYSQDSARCRVNTANGFAQISTPAETKLKIYPVVSGKTYKVTGWCANTGEWPLLIVYDDKVTTSPIAWPNTFDHVLGTSSSEEEKTIEYTAQRTGFLYLNYYDSICGLWEKVDTPVPSVKYHMDEIKDVKLPLIISGLEKGIYHEKVDSKSEYVKKVPKYAEKIAKITNLHDSITLVRSITGRNLINKDAIENVIIDVNGTKKKGVKTTILPPGRYRIILGAVTNYVQFKKFEHGVFSAAYWQDVSPINLTIVDPAGGYFVVYADSIEKLGDMSSMIIARLKDGENTVEYETYTEKVYTPDRIAYDPYIDVNPDGLVEFVNSENAAVDSTIKYIIAGRGDDSTTSKDFVISPNGSKFLPMVKNDGSAAYARVVPKKALFIGNSLTSGWQTFGESATEHTKDFIARFYDVVSDLDDDFTFDRIWATGFEQQTSLADAQTWTTTNIDPYLESDLDLIVVQLSDNVTGSSQGAVFPDTSLWLLQHLRTECQKARVVWMGVWFDRGWVQTLLNNTAQTGSEYVDIRPLYNVSNMAYIGMVYEMEADYTKTYEVDSFTVDNGKIVLVFTVDGTQYTATIPSYTSYTSSSDTSISVTGVYHVANTYYESIHPGDEGFRKIANKLLFDLGISDSEETIPADA